MDFNALVKNTTGRLCDNLKEWDEVGGDIYIYTHT